MTISASSTPSRQLILLTTGRAIKNLLSKLDSSASGFLPRITTVGEFFSNVLVFQNRSEVDKISKQILLHKAYSRCDQLSKLGFEKEFLRFLSSSDFLDKFFSELNRELVSLDRIETGDTYAEFDEHLQILKSVSKTYLDLLNEKLLYDSKYESNWSINELYLALFDSIYIEIDGLPTNQELQILEHISKSKPVVLSVHKNRFSGKLLDKLGRHGVNLAGESDGTYEVNLSTKAFTLISKPEIVKNIKFATFSERVHQVGFVFHMIEEYIKIGVEPEKICIILPDESFAQILQPFDTYRNINFAMGRSVSELEFISKLVAAREYLCLDSEEAVKKLKYYGCFEKVKNFASIETLLSDIGYKNEEAIKVVVENELQTLKNAINQHNIDLKNALWVFTEALLGHKIDDVGGGKITALGVLETRGSSFEAVIVVDFNEQKVPKPDEKDLFLNAKIRSRCDLPTRADRENLQINYYHRLFEGSKYISICAIKNEREMPSGALRFFSTADAGFSDIEANKVLVNLLTKKPPIKINQYTDTNLYKIKQFSATSLKDFLECKKKYYLKHIKKLKEYEDESKLKTSEMGVLFHATVAKVITPNIKLDKTSLVGGFEAELAKAMFEKNSSEYRFETTLLFSKLGLFFEKEAKRAETHTPQYVEQEFLFPVFGIDIKGKIDRLDIDKDGFYHVIDYKLKENILMDSLKKIEKKPEGISDFQLAIYTIASANLLNLDVQTFLDKHFKVAGYYSVYDGEILVEECTIEKITLLYKLLSDISKLTLSADQFTKCDKKSTCRLCAYQEICSAQS